MTISIKDTGAALTLALALALPAAGHAQDGGGTSALAEGLMMLRDSTEAGPEAPTGWYNCEVIRTGAGWGNHYVALTCPSVNNEWHVLEDSQKDSMLATALAAATSDNRVEVYVQQQNGYDLVRAIYLHK